MNEKQLAQRPCGTERTDDRTMPTDEAILTHEVTGDGTVSEGVVDALAAVTNVEPAEMDPLAEAVDPDALDALFADRHDGTPRDCGRTRFEFCGHEVVVSGTGHVSVLE